MAKGLNQSTVSVNMQFTADTENAKRQIQSLQQQLTNLMKSGSNVDTLGINGEISDAISKCASLKAALESATDVKTGNLDLGIFNKSLEKSKIKISDYAKALSALGPEGEQAFTTLAQSIVIAEVPMKKTNALLQEFKTTLANTARWQISSSILHGFMGSLQSAFYYAQDLNESLNNIRIVTGQNTDQMAKFAKQANAAAQSLSTTTTDYTNASLIYYQQGLSDEEVLDRTNTTVKMANVAGETAETVSDQMTAIWNNFYDGSKSIEYYADVLAKLGATTASSSAEISEGVEKFASVASTVGLSYEYAASAIATVTAETRQSADVVGTAFKTMFARIQDLEQGNTLDDGTTLGTYAQALEKVGISIKDQEGNLKDMDNILEEMGAKWQTIAKDQQVALAENLAGTRQYTQLISLMDNWDKFQENLTMAYGSEGTLQQQANIYAESWEAALNRVQAAAENIYSKLIDDKFIIKVLDVIEKIINGIDDMISGLGGLKGVLSVASTLLLNTFGDNIVKNIQRITDNFKQNSGISTLRQQTASAMQTLYLNNGTTDTDAARSAVYKQQANLQDTILKTTEELSARNIEVTDEEKKQLQYLLDVNDALGKQYIQITENREAQEKAAQVQENKAKSLVRQASRRTADEETPNYPGKKEDINIHANTKAQEFSSAMKDAKQLAKQSEVGITLANRISNIKDSISKNGTISNEDLVSFKDQISGIATAIKDIDPDTFVEFEEGLNQCATANDADTIQEGIQKINDASQKLTDETDAAFAAIKNIYSEGMSGQELENFTKLIDESRQQMEKSGELTVNQIQKFKDYGIQITATGKIVKNFGDQQKDLASTLVTASQSISAIITAINNLSGIIDTIADTSISDGKKIISIVSSLALTIPILLNGVEKLTTVMGLTIPHLTAIVIAITAVATIVSAVIGYFKQLDQAAEDARQEQLKLAQTVANLSESEEDLVETTQDLINKYKNLAAVGEDVTETVEELQKKLPELVQSYKDLADALDIDISDQIEQLEYYIKLAGLTGDYSNAESTSDEISGVIDQAKYESQKQGLSAAMGSLAHAYGQQGLTTDNNVLLTARGYGSEEKKAAQILNDYLSDYVGYSKDGFMEFSVDTSDQEEMLDFYEKLQEARDAMLDTSNMTAEEVATSGIYKDIDEWINNLSDSYDAVTEQAKVFSNTASKALINALGDGSEIKTMEEYKEYRQNMIDLGTSEYNLTEDEVEALLDEKSVLNSIALQYKLINSLQSKFSKSEGYEEFINKISGLSNDELQIAIALAPTADSLDEFERLFEQACTQALNNAYSTSAITVQTVLNTAAENNKFSSSDWDKLKADQNFLDYLDSIGQDFESLKSTAANSFAEQYAIVSQYYTNLQALQQINYNQQIAQYAQEIADKEEALNLISTLTDNEYNIMLSYQKSYLKALDDADKAETDEEKQRAEELANYYAEFFSQKYGFEITTNIVDIESDIDALNKKIQSIQGKKIEIITDWSGVDTIENGLKQIASFAQLIEDDTTKVGNSYQLTASQAKEWMEVYPDLFAQAKVTSDGIIELDKTVVDNYIDGQDAALDAGIEAQITMLEAQKADLEAELELKEKDLKAVEQLEQGKCDLSDVSAQYLSDLRKNLTEYYIGLGFDEEEANAQALADMSTDEETYSKTVAEASNKNVENVTKAAQSGGEAQANILSQLSVKYNNLSTLLAKVSKNINNAYEGGEIDTTQNVISHTVSATVASVEQLWARGGGGSTAYNYQGYTSTDGYHTDATSQDNTVKDSLAKVAKAQFDSIINSVSETLNGINSLDSKIAYLRALQNQDLSKYGKTSTSSGSSKSLSSEDLKVIAERYHDINSEISTQEILLKRANNAANKLYGKNKIAAMKEQEAILQTLIDDETQLKDLALGDLAGQQLLIQDKFSYANFDSETFRLTNYSEIEKEITQAYNDAAEKYNKSSQDDAAKQEWKNAQDIYTKNKKLIDDYESIYNTYQDSVDKIQEYIDQKQQEAYDLINYEMERREDLLERELKVIDSQISILGDSFYKMAEIQALYNDNYLDNYNNQYLAAQASADQALQWYNEGKISQDQYISALKTTQDTTLNTIKSILELDETMSNYYSKTIKAGQEELSTYTSQMTNLTKILDHYKTLLNLSGRQYDYKTIGAILDSSLTNARNLYEISKANYDDLQERADRLKDKLENDNLQEKEREMLQSEYNELVAQAQTASETMYSYLEEIGNTAAEIFSNTLSQIREDFESSLSDAYTSFDDLNTKIERLSSSQSDYLTKTNQLYETNKLIRQATEDMNITESKQAKQRYNDYIQYIQKLQDSEQLSQTKLEIAQAEYEVLQAQMALEDAKNNKSTVRMSKDSEGNWGYVYTANQSDISDKQQSYEDALNKLYNIGVNGAQSTSSELAQIVQDAYDTLEDIAKKRREGYYKSEEEYNAAIESAQKYFYQRLEALGADYSDYQDILNRYSSQGMIDYSTISVGSIDDIKNAYKEAESKISDNYDSWKSNTNEVTKVIGNDYDDTKDKINDVTSASTSLSNYIQNTLLGTLQEEYNQVEKVALKYAEERDAIYKALAAKQAYAQFTQNQIEEQTVSSGDTDWSQVMYDAWQSGNTDLFNYAYKQREAKGYDLKLGKTSDIAEYIESGKKIEKGQKFYEIDEIKEKIANYDTGGYTGSWGPEGKLATVHEEELILNKDDAKTFIDTTNRLASISNLLDILASSSSLGLGDLLSGISMNNSSTLQQEVHIEANFPNATDKSEIEGAFENLINLASQYANRKV